MLHRAFDTPIAERYRKQFHWFEKFPLLKLICMMLEVLKNRAVNIMSF